MKFLYVSFVGKTEQNSGILKKVMGQTRGVAELGWDARYICLEGDSVLLNDGGGMVKRKELPHPLRWRAKQNAVTERICEFLREESYDVVYIKGFLTSPYAYRIAKCAKSENQSSRVIFEIATYPYWSTYRRLLKKDAETKNFRSLLGNAFEILQHGATVSRMKRRTDLLAVFGKPVDRLWGIPVVMLDNGVDLEQIPLKKGNGGSEIRLLGVAGTTISHGYSRVLEGLARYRESGLFSRNPVIFEIAGDNGTIAALKEEARSLHLEDCVHFLGYLDQTGLNRHYDACDAAVSVLGGYRFGLQYMSPIKSREYCAAGIPFLYAYEDTLPSDAPFAMKIANDPSPVDIPSVVRFVQQCRGRPEISRQERQFAEDHFAWKIIMERVLTLVCAAAKDKN